MVATKRADSPRPTPLEKTRDRIEQWRKTRPYANTPMPAVLWRAAVVAVQEHGLYPTARALRVDYGALKTHVQAASAPPPTFVELPVADTPGTRCDGIECVLEREAPNGTRRVRVHGLSVDAVLALARLVWSAGQ